MARKAGARVAEKEWAFGRGGCAEGSVLPYTIENVNIWPAIRAKNCTNKFCKNLEMSRGLCYNK